MAPSAQPAPLPTGGPTSGGDELDDLFDYDVGGENDPFSNNYKVPGAKNSTTENANAGKSGANLGIDEEIEVTRKPRPPRVKLDENRLLSANGIPKLRKKAKDLKLKGKGHEYSDATRLLAFYQLWLDDLFPKARFLDALAMVEKMGHKRMLQTARMEWIDEGKPKSHEEEATLFGEPLMPTREEGNQESTATRIAPIFEKPTSERPKTPTVDIDADMEDLYDATPRASRTVPTGTTTNQGSIFGGNGKSMFGGGNTTTTTNEDFDDDDLDALLAEEDALHSAGGQKQLPITQKPTMAQDNFDDEMEAMAEMDGMW